MMGNAINMFVEIWDKRKFAWTLQSTFSGLLLVSKHFFRYLYETTLKNIIQSANIHRN